jgi:phage tail protein X
MNARIFACVAALLLAAPGLAQSQAAKPPAPLRGQLLLPEFAALTDKASEVVNVTLDSRLLGMACRFLSSEDPEEAQAKKFCTSLRGIYVRHFTFDSDFAYPKADIDGVKRQLRGPAWSQIVGAISKKDNTDVEVYVLIDGDKAQGLSIIANQPREFTIVNIVGSIDLEQLHELEGKFGVPELAIEPGKTPPKTQKK